jgi:hypothetical protein
MHSNARFTWLTARDGCGVEMRDGLARTPGELLILEKLREKNSQRLFAGFASFRHALQSTIPPPNLIHCPRQMLRDLRFSKFGHSAKRCAVK